MSEEFFNTIEESNIVSADQALNWFKAVLSEDALAFNFETGVSIDESGASARHLIMALTSSCIVTWQISRVDEADEDNIEEVSHLEIVTQILPFSKVLNVITRQIHTEDGVLKRVTATVTMASQDFVHANDEQHSTIFYDILPVIKDNETSSEEEMEQGLTFINKLAGLYAAAQR